MTLPQVAIRPYQPADRSAVRRIAWETCDKGQPGNRLFPDREFLVDMVTQYYVTLEPQSAFVADCQGQVVGYLLGCLDSHRFDRCMTWRIVPAALWRAVCRGALLDPRVRRLLRRNLSAGPSPLRKVPGVNRDYPAHVHINLDSAFRGRKLGVALLERFEDRARGHHAAGIHASVREDNESTRRFFERNGFALIARRMFMRLDASGGGMLFSVVYGKRLS